LGVKQQAPYTIILVIAEKTWEGLHQFLHMSEEYEATFNKQIAMSAVRIEVLPSLEAASKSPWVGMASFIFFPEEGLVDVASYPELGELLPTL
jgi:ABC-type polysaccharide transport system permease subunit